jgi:biuret amidohydrolase
MTDLLVGNAALLIIDMQHDFLDDDSSLAAVGGASVIPRISSVVGAARAAGVPVIFSQELHRASGVDRGRENDPGVGTSYGTPQGAVPPHCVEGTRGADLVDGVGLRDGDLVIAKRRYSCFLGTELEYLLNQLEVRTLLVAGLITNCCVLWTVGDAFQRDSHVRVIEDCTAASSPEEHEAALLIMRNLTTGRPVLSGEVIDALGRR